MTPPRKDALYPFEFETVQVDEQGQVIEREQGRAFAFREPLADKIGLEMVAIPSGKFMMGAPESEYDSAEPTLRERSGCPRLRNPSIKRSILRQSFWVEIIRLNF